MIQEVTAMETKGKIVNNLKATKTNPRNSEGAFLELKDGKLMFAYRVI